MKLLRRILIIPATIAVVVLSLMLAGIIAVETTLPLETLAWIAGGILAVLIVWEIAALIRSWRLPDPEEPPTYEGVITPRDVQQTPQDVEREAVEKVEEAEAYTRRVKERVRIRIDMELDDKQDD